jgi:prevent-host-death family protein
MTWGSSKQDFAPMKRVALSAVKDDLSKYLRLAERDQVVITRHGKAAGVLVGFASEEAWFDYQLEHDVRFMARIESARRSIRGGRGVRLEDLDRTTTGAARASRIPASERRPKLAAAKTTARRTRAGRSAAR